MAAKKQAARKARTIKTVEDSAQQNLPGIEPEAKAATNTVDSGSEGIRKVHESNPKLKNSEIIPKVKELYGFDVSASQVSAVRKKLGVESRPRASKTQTAATPKPAVAKPSTNGHSPLADYVAWAGGSVDKAIEILQVVKQASGG